MPDLLGLSALPALDKISREALQQELCHPQARIWSPARVHFQRELFNKRTIAECLQKVDGDRTRRDQSGFVAQGSGTSNGCAQVSAARCKPPGGKSEHALPAIDIHALRIAIRRVGISTVNPIESTDFTGTWTLTAQPPAPTGGWTSTRTGTWEIHYITALTGETACAVNP